MYDEAIDVVNAEEVKTPPMSAASENDHSPSSVLEAKDEEDYPQQDFKALNEKPTWELPDRGLIAQLSERSENSEDEEDDDTRAAPLQGGYDPAEYDDLAVTSEIKQLFGHITKYIPQTIELETKLSPFLPDLIPAVGDIDGFLKVPRPDGVKDELGLTVLDEPCTIQTDPVVLQLQLRAQAKRTEDKQLVVKKVVNADSNSKAVEKWINAISDLHQRKPPPTVHYSKPMPNLDNLMQEWPEKMEELFESMTVPSPELDCDFSTYVTILCNMFDIPVYENKIQSLHMFFNLYSTMKSTKNQLVQETEQNDLTM